MAPAGIGIGNGACTCGVQLQPLVDALTAKTVQRFAVMLIDGHEERDQEALLRGIRSMAERIGIVADMAAERVEKHSVVVGDAVDWMMPPVFLDDETKSVQP